MGSSDEPKLLLRRGYRRHLTSLGHGVQLLCLLIPFVEVRGQFRASFCCFVETFIFTMSGLFFGEGSLANHLLVCSPDLVPLYCRLCWLSKTPGNFSFKVMFCHSSGMNGLEVSVQLSAAVWKGWALQRPRGWA